MAIHYICNTEVISQTLLFLLFFSLCLFLGVLVVQIKQLLWNVQLVHMLQQQALNVNLVPKELHVQPMDSLLIFYALMEPTQMLKVWVIVKCVQLASIVQVLGWKHQKNVLMEHTVMQLVHNIVFCVQRVIGEVIATINPCVDPCVDPCIDVVTYSWNTTNTYSWQIPPNFPLASSSILHSYDKDSQLVHRWSYNLVKESFIHAFGFSSLHFNSSVLATLTS